MTRPAATLFWWQLCLRFDSESDCRWQCGQKHSQMEGEITRLGGTERPRVGGSDQRWRKSGRPGPRKCWPCAVRSKFGPCLRLGPPGLQCLRVASWSPDSVRALSLSRLARGSAGRLGLGHGSPFSESAWAMSQVVRPKSAQAVTVSESRVFQVEVSPSFQVEVSPSFTGESLTRSDFDQRLTTDPKV